MVKIFKILYHPENQYIMKRIIPIYDLHGRASWKLIVFQNPDCKYIFGGDYFDSFNIDSETQQRNFKEICEFKEEHPDDVVLLYGNHCTSYILGDICSGYQYGAEHSIKHLFSTYKDLFKMAHNEENILFTHAGIGESWLDWVTRVEELGSPKTAKEISDTINDIWKHKPVYFVFNGRDGYGDDMGQTPVWIRPRSLRRDSANIKKAGIIQIVGHTGQPFLDIEQGKKDGVFLVDTLGMGDYLIIDVHDDGKLEFSTKSVK